MKIGLKTGLAGGFVVAMAALPAMGQEVIRLTVATGHAPAVNWVRLLDESFIPGIDAALAQTGHYRIDWTRGYSGTIARIGGEIDALEDGVADLAIVGATFNPDRLPLQTVAYYTPFVSDRLGMVVPVLDEMNRSLPAMQALWDRNGLRYLAGIGVDNFQLFSTRPITSYHDLEGMKIGGIGPNLNWLLPGMTGVALQPNSAYTDLQTGVYEAALAPASLGLTLRINEAAPYMVEVNFGAMSWGALAMNAEVFEGLPEEVQTVIAEAGRRFQADLIAFTENKVADDIATMQAAGLQVLSIPEAERAEWAASLPNIAARWAEGLEAEGLPAREVVAEYLRRMTEAGASPARDWSDSM